MIKPTVGRKVYYRPSTDRHDEDDEMLTHVVDGVTQPLDATVIAVYADDVINLSIFDIHGHLFSRRNVKLIQEGDRAPSMGRYAEWMPYQVKQAAKDNPEAPKPTTIIDKAVHHDEAMDKLTQVGVPLGMTLVGRIEWMMANGAKAEPANPNIPDRPMLQYGIEELRSAWDYPANETWMNDGNLFTKTDIDAELRYRGDSYGSPRAVATPLMPKTKSA